MSAALARRLTANYTHPGEPVLHLGDEHPVAAPSPRSVALVVTTWPREDTDAGEHVAFCAELLRPGGCLAIVVIPTHIPEQLGILVGAGREAGLTYLQHIVVAHRLGQHHHPAGAAHPGRRPPRRSARRARGHLTRHVRVHTDVLVLAQPRGAHA